MTAGIPVADSRPDDDAWPSMAWPPSPDTVLRGDVVEVAPVDPSGRGVAGLFEALDHEVVWRHLSGRPVDAQGLARRLGARVDAGWLPWLVRLRGPLGDLPGGAVVGTSSFLDVSVEDARLEIGFTAYTPGVWATSVNPETKLLLLEYAFTTLHAGRVQLKTDVRNHRSQRAIDRLGARYEGTLRRYQRRADGTVRDTALFSVVAEEWPGVRAGLIARLRPGRRRDGLSVGSG